MKTFEELAADIGKLVGEKNKAYGSAFDKTGDFLKILYPNGIKPEQYKDALCVVRIFDKLMRIATSYEGTSEKAKDAYSDIIGYGLLGLRATLEKGTEEPAPAPPVTEEKNAGEAHPGRWAELAFLPYTEGGLSGTKADPKSEGREPNGYLYKGVSPIENPWLEAKKQLANAPKQEVDSITVSHLKDSEFSEPWKELIKSSAINRSDTKKLDQLKLIANDEKTSPKEKKIAQEMLAIFDIFPTVPAPKPAKEQKSTPTATVVKVEKVKAPEGATLEDIVGLVNQTPAGETPAGCGG